MAVKLLIAAESNSGKTTLTKDLEDSLVISHDGKSYPYKKPHKNVLTFSSTKELTTLVNETVGKYKDKYGVLPKTIVFDSVSKVFDTLMDVCNTKHTGFKVYSALNSEIFEFTDYIQNTLIENGLNVVLISHALWDSETAKYNLIGKGDFSKRGGFLAETDNSIFLETKNGKRIIHFRSTKFPARTLQEDLPDSMPVEEFSLNKHIQTLEENQSAADEFEL